MNRYKIKKVGSFPMKKTSWSLLTLLFALMLVLAACGGGDKKEETNKGSDQGTNNSGETADNESNEQEMEEKDMNKFNVDHEENKFFEEAKEFIKEMETEMARGVSNGNSLIKNIAIIGGCMFAGAIVGWGIGRLFSEVIDTTEVVNDETFFKY